MPATSSRRPSTEKGQATRDRIVSAAAELMYRHGVAGSSTPAVRAAARVSSSQIYHYFADKDALTQAVIDFQTEAIIDGQTPLLVNLADLDALDAWRDFIVASAQQQHGAGGCPLGSLSSELSDENVWAQERLAASFTRWAEAIGNALDALVEHGTLRPDTDTSRLALALLAALQGGLLLAQAQHNTDALQAGLDTVIQRIRDHAATPW
jgi:TetR/AcrR family transcriptional repressor of nem operon